MYLHFLRAKCDFLLVCYQIENFSLQGYLEFVENFESYKVLSESERESEYFLWSLSLLNVNIKWLWRRSACVSVCALSNLMNYNSAALPSMTILNLAAFLSQSHNSAAKQILMLLN